MECSKNDEILSNLCYMIGKKGLSYIRKNMSGYREKKISMDASIGQIRELTSFISSLKDNYDWKPTYGSNNEVIISLNDSKKIFGEDEMSKEITLDNKIKIRCSKRKTARRKKKKRKVRRNPRKKTVKIVPSSCKNGICFRTNKVRCTIEVFFGVVAV